MINIPNFRVWYDEKLWVLAKLDLWGDPDQTTCDLAPYLPKYSEKFNIPLAEVKLMQSTGLKDKNGVEIYDGDIVNVLGTIEGLEDDLGVVRFVDAAFVIDYDNLNSEFDYFNTVSLPVKVIGNIYDNLELLEGK